MKGIVCGMEISMATTEELLQTILQSLEKVEYIKSEDIPNIDLYMDQVLTFMDRKLRSAVRPQTEDRVLTKTMINNYAKNDLLPPPVKKKYSKEHVLMLIFIYYYKGVIPMNEIQTLLQPITDHYFQNGQAFDLESVYKEVVSLEKEQLEDLKKRRSGQISQSREFLYGDLRRRTRILTEICLDLSLKF